MLAGKESRLQRLLAWYRVLVKPFLIRVEPQKVEEFDRDTERVETRKKRINEELAVCFLGSSGVGKSTLINALVAGKDILLPTGGVGPLTAQALTVRHSQQPRFEVQYHSPQKLWQLIFALEQINKTEQTFLSSHKTEVDGPRNLLDADTIAEIERDLSVPKDADDSQKAEQKAYRDQLKKQAQLMVKGNQNSAADLAYLIASLKQVGGWGSDSTIQPDLSDLKRIQRLKAALEFAKINKTYVRHSDSEGDSVFTKDLHAHASGFLAPLIKELQVFWDSPMLQEGLAVVDLPGLGIAGDVNREIAHEWIRKKARAVILVVDHRGITQDSTDLLYKSGFLNNLLYTSDDPADDPVLIIAVVKVDDIADTRYSGDKTKRKTAHFKAVCAETVENVKAQLQSELEKHWSLDTSETSEQRTKVLNNILSTLQVHPVSAIQYRRILENDEEDRPFITNAEESNIPRFRSALQGLVRARRQRISQALDETVDNFFLQVNGALNIIHAQWNEGNRAKEEADRLREDLMKFIKPKQKEFYSRQGAFREFLKNTIPQRIEALVKDASRKAEKDIQRYLNGLRNVHWNTLKASVRRGGTYSGARHIDLPVDFALRFEEPVAEIWATKLLKEIRSTTKDFTDDCVSLVEEVASWAKDQGTRVSAAIIEAKREAIKADSEKLTAVGKEMVEEMRESVKASLIKSIESPIRKKCAAFIKKGDDVGTGVKARILELFGELAEDVVAAAAEPAVTLLKNNFAGVEEEIRSVLKQYDDPLLSAAKEIVASHENRVRRSDEQKRKAVTEEIETIWQNIPASFVPSKASRVLE